MAEQSQSSTPLKATFALAGPGGFNTHGAGFLTAARECEVVPLLITATSGQIVVLADWLQNNDLKTALINPELEHNSVAQLQVALYGDPGIFKPAYAQILARWWQVGIVFNAYNFKTGEDVLYGNPTSISRTRGSPQLDLGHSDHSAPFLGVCFNELGELGGRTRKRFPPSLGKPSLHFRIGEHYVNLAVKPFDDCGRCVLGARDPTRHGCFEAWQEIADGW
jgi:hypothetical protein